MGRKSLRAQLVFVTLLAALPAAQAASIELQSVAFPEKKTIELPIVNTPVAPAARIQAEVLHRQGQTRIELAYSSMKPAILFGGDVTCYVAWAVTRDGAAENLGELTTRKSSGRLSLQTGQKHFALMVTAEAYYLVSQPSEIVVFKNVGPLGQSGLVSSFRFENFAPAPEHHVDGIAHLKWDSDVPLELLQARKAYEMATENAAAFHAPEIHAEAGTALQKANEYARGTSRSRELLDTARRAVALSNEALNISLNRIEAIELEKEMQRRREETAALERRAAEAEAAMIQAQRFAEQARRDVDQLRRDSERMRAEKQRLGSETAALLAEKATLENAMVVLRQEKLRHQGASERLQVEKTGLEQDAVRLREEKGAIEEQARRLERKTAELAAQAEHLQLEKAALERQFEQLRREKAELAGRLESALSHVADTRESARGYVVNLPDILFDVNEATLKPDARMTIAKLAGILLILPNQKVLIEGHTDSTGSVEYNLNLSQQRANAVLGLLRSQGIDRSRLEAQGFGMEQPVADNSTPAGRRRNRRVEIIISGGTQQVAQN